MFYVLGDSIAKGVILNEIRDRYVILKDSCFELATRALDISYKNLSSFGATIDKGLAIFDRYNEEFEEGQTIFLEFGGNDCNHQWAEVAENPEGQHGPNVSKEDFLNKYSNLVERCLEKGLKPVITSLPPLSSEYFFNYLAKKLDGNSILKWIKDVNAIFDWQEGYDEIVRAIADKYELPVLEFRKAILQQPHYEELICSDGMHPNAAGHVTLAQAVISYINDNDELKGK